MWWWGRRLIPTTLRYNSLHASLFQRWKITVHSLRPHHISGVVGQTTKSSLFVKGGNTGSTVQPYTSHPGSLTFPPPLPLTLMPDRVAELPFLLRPLAPGRREILVNLKDIATHEIQSSWLVVANVRSAVITRSYDITLQTAETANKKVMYTNPYVTRKVYKLSTSHPSLLSFKEDILDIPERGQQFIGIKFSARETPGAVQILIFINDETDKGEDCLAVNVTYK